MGINDLGKVYDDGEIIIRQGDLGSCMYVVLDGTVEVVVAQDQAVAHLAVLGEGDFFGEMGLFEHRARSATVRALGRARILTVDKKTVLRKIRQDPTLALRFLEIMSDRIQRMNNELLARERKN